MSLVSTPCIRVCQLDGELGLCLGCGRTREEIGGWMRMSEDERLAIMSGLKARLDAAGPAEDAATPDLGLGNWRAGV